MATLSVCSLALTSPPHPHTSRLRVTWLKVELWLRFGMELKLNQARLRLMFRMRLMLKLGLEFRLRFEGLD